MRPAQLAKQGLRRLRAQPQTKAKTLDKGDTQPDEEHRSGDDGQVEQELARKPSREPIAQGENGAAGRQSQARHGADSPGERLPAAPPSRWPTRESPAP